MTVEELEIIVTAKVEEALKEFKKITPTVKKIVKETQDSFQEMKFNGIKDKLASVVQEIRNKLKSLKNTSKNNNIKIAVNNTEAKAQITQIEKEIESLQKKISAREMQLQITNDAIDKTKFETRNEISKNNPNLSLPQLNNRADLKLSDDKSYISLINQSDKLNNEVLKYTVLLDAAKGKLASLNRENEKVETSQGKLTSFFNGFKSKLDQLKSSMKNLTSNFKILPNIGKNLGNNMKSFEGSIKNGVKSITKYALALFSLRGIYSVLSNSASSWLSSQNAGAKQLSANIDYMKYAMGSTLAPIIQFVTNLVYQLMKAIQSVVYALSGVNIFAKASASSYTSMANSASKAKKETQSLAGIHSEINNVSSSDNSDSGSNRSTSPNIDLSNVDNNMSGLAQKLYNFFKPFVESWNKYGEKVILAFKNAVDGVGQAISSMWSSVETLFTNGTIYSIISDILNSIGQLGVAWANAWNNGNNGTEIIQGIANVINNVTSAIFNLVSSTGFQSFLDGVFNTISGIVQFIEPIAKSCTDMTEKILEIVFSDIGNVLKTVGDSLQSIAQNETVSEILKAVGQAIAIVVSAIALWNIAQAILNGLMGIFAVVTSPITLIILAIIAAITAIILIIKNWGAISEWFQDLWVKITQKLQEVWNNIKEFFGNLWNSIIDTIKTVWNNIKEFLSNLWNGILNIVKTVFNAVATFFSNIWNGIKNVVSTVWNGITNTISNVINGIRDTIWNVLNGIATIWDNIWSGLKTTVSNIFNGIWDIIKNIINSILNGIEGMANGIVRGINTVINALNKLKFDIPDWIPGLGGKTFGFNIGMVPQVTLPRLAKGNVAYSETMAIFGEYSGASTNPEITAPQNIMRETFEDVLSNYENRSSNSTGELKTLIIQFGSTKVALEIENLLKQARRQNGTAYASI